MLLCYHFSSLLQASAHSECARGQAGPQCLSFQLLFLSLFINSLQEEKELLRAGFSFSSFFFLYYIFQGVFGGADWMRPFAFTTPCCLETSIIEIHICSLEVAVPS